MFSNQPRLALAVPHLLTDVGATAGAVVMPDQGRRRESDLPSARLEPPAHVDVVACSDEGRIESADGHQRLAPEGAVAAGNVLGESIVDEDVRRPSRGSGDRLSEPRIVDRYDIGSARTDDTRHDKGLNEVGQPVRIDPDVCVGIRDDISGRGVEPDVARGRETGILDIDDANAAMAG